MRKSFLMAMIIWFLTALIANPSLSENFYYFDANIDFNDAEKEEFAAYSEWSEPALISDRQTPEDSLQAYDHGDPSSEEQLMLELINASRSDPEQAAEDYETGLNEGLAAGTISSSPKQPLAFNPRLIEAAREHSRWMLDTQTFSHAGEGGSLSQDRIEDAGYEFTGTWVQGENIGMSGTTGPFDVEEHLHRVNEDLFESPDHREVTFSEDFNEIGIGALTGTFQGVDSLMVTQKYAVSDSTPTPMLVGVVYEDVNGNGQYDLGEGVQGITITPDRGDFYAVTSESGGFAVPLPDLDDTLNVTASGERIPEPVTKQVTLTGENVKLDFVVE